MTTKQRPNTVHYHGVPLDMELLDAYPDIWEPLPDTGMQQKYYEDIMQAVRSWLGDRPDVFVSGNTGVYYEEGNRNAVFLPDCYVVFGDGAEHLWDPYAYRIWDFGHPPAFALEIGSPSTYRNDLGYKRELYARVGIGEYWLYDPTGGENYGEPLIGLYLDGREYRRFDLNSEQGGIVWAYSPTLRVNLRWTPRRLQLQDPVTGEIQGNVLEEKAARLAAEARAQSAEYEVARLQAQLRQLRGD